MHEVNASDSSILSDALVLWDHATRRVSTGGIEHPVAWTTLNGCFARSIFEQNGSMRVLGAQCGRREGTESINEAIPDLPNH